MHRMLEPERKNFAIFSQLSYVTDREPSLTGAPQGLLQVQSKPESSGDGIPDLPPASCLRPR